MTDHVARKIRIDRARFAYICSDIKAKRIAYTFASPQTR